MKDELEKVVIHGNKQWLLYWGQPNSPILLFIHGGPGSPLMYFSRAYDSLLIREFLVVHWDQRLTGKSYEPNVPIESYNIDQLTKDGIAVMEHIKSKFPISKIILVGHSFGTIVGSHMVQARPDLFSAYVSVGTITDFRKGDQLKLEVLRTKIAKWGSEADRKALVEMGLPPWAKFEQLVILSRLMGKFGGNFHAITTADIDAAVRRNKEYNEAEMKNVNVAMSKIWTQILPYLRGYKAVESVPELKLPVFFVQGRYDLATPTELAKSFFDRISAPKGKQWIEFSNSAHFPMFEEQEKFLKTMREIASQLGE